MLCPQLLTLLTFSTWYSSIWCILILFMYLRFVMGWIRTNWKLIAREAHDIWYNKPDSPKDPHSLDNWLQLGVHLGFSCRYIIETCAIFFGCLVLRFLLAFIFLASPMGILRFLTNDFPSQAYSIRFEISTCHARLYWRLGRCDIIDWNDASDFIIPCKSGDNRCGARHVHINPFVEKWYCHFRIQIPHSKQFLLEVRQWDLLDAGNIFDIVIV